MGADDMRKLIEATYPVTQLIRRVPLSKVTWDESQGIPGLPTVKGVDADWQIADWHDFNSDTFAQFADAVAPYGLYIYLIQDTGSDYIWFAVAK